MPARLISASYYHLARAKINLALHIVGRHANGYHKLETLNVFANFGDYISISPANTDSIILHGAFAKAELTENTQDNLAVKARKLLQEEAKDQKKESFPTLIKIKKNIPIAAGLGGGSADAASVLHLLNMMWELNLPQNRLYELGLQLGSDVPICLYNKTCLAYDIGQNIPQNIKPYTLIKPLYILLINPGIMLSTKDVFDHVYYKNNAKLFVPETMQEYNSFREWFSLTRNDLTNTAQKLKPEIEFMLDSLKHCAKNYPPRMCGSGATCFVLFETLNDAYQALSYVKKTSPSYWAHIGSVI